MRTIILAQAAAAGLFGSHASPVDGRGNIVVPKPEYVEGPDGIEQDHTPNRAERRRRAKVAHLEVPPSLDTRKAGWDRRLLDVINKVYVDGALIPNCVAYDMHGGWAKPRGGEVVKGRVEVTRK